jgi:hypothetical protein
MKKFIFTVSLLFFSLFAFAQFSITVESGAAFNGSNDVQAPNAPNNKGTRFSLTDDFTPTQPVIFLRAEASYLLNERHRFRLTAVPLTFNYDKNGSKQISFDGTIFDDANLTSITSPPNTTASYQFNTYRVSYRYRLVNREKTKFELGLTGLLRDAKIELTQGSTNQKNTDLGFVPLISFYLGYDFTPKFTAEITGDALVGPVGRAEDIFAGFRINLLQDKVQTKVGYRIIEGGADVDQVYNFSLFHFATVGLTATF